MLNPKFVKVVLVIGAVGVAGALTANQALLVNKVNKLENRAPVIVVEKVLPSVSPTATPSAKPTVSLLPLRKSVTIFPTATEVNPTK